MTTPNSPVSRTVKVMVRANSLAKQLTRVALDTPSQPVRVLFTKEGMSVWTHDLTKTMHVFLTHAPLEDYKRKEDCIMLVNPKEFADLLSTKFRDQQVRISTEAHKPITIQEKTTKQFVGRVVYHSADEDDCAIVPDRWQMPESRTKPGWKSIPQQGGETCTTRIEISRCELVKGVVDMQVANAPYCQFVFTPKVSFVGSGHWGSKTNSSQSVIECKVEGHKNTEIGLTNTLTQVLSMTEGDDFILHKHKATPFVIMECGDMECVVAETTKEV